MGGTLGVPPSPLTGDRTMLVRLDKIVYADPDGWPLIGYVYGHDGYHSGKNWLENPDQLREFIEKHVNPAIQEKREVMITDGGDYAVFHSKDGETIHDAIQHPD
jgi:hypothetical protein